MNGADLEQLESLSSRIGLDSSAVVELRQLVEQRLVLVDEQSMGSVKLSNSLLASLELSDTQPKKEQQSD